MLRVDGELRRMGFFTTRFVDAPDVDHAGAAAVALLREEGRLKPLNDSADPPRIFFDELDEAHASDVPEVPQGLAYYPDDPEAVS